MSLQSVVREVCAVVGVAAPATSVLSNINANRTMFEMFTLANEMSRRIAYDNREWTRLKNAVTFVGDGVTEAFPLPASYKRMLKTSQVWRSTSAIQPMVFYPDTDEWLQRRVANYYSAWGEWSIYGGNIHIWPVMGVGVTAHFTYLDKNCIALTGGGVNDEFRADTDVFLLDERLLKLGMIWQWKANKGSPYAEDMANFETALAVAQGADVPAPIIADRRPISSYARTAYPYPLPTSFGGP